MAVEFPTDHYVFSVVLTDQVEIAPTDKGVLREIQDRIPGFKASRELDQTLLNVLKLEQLIGKKIDWVAAPFTFDELIHQTTNYPGFRGGATYVTQSKSAILHSSIKVNADILALLFKLLRNK